MTTKSGFLILVIILVLLFSPVIRGISSLVFGILKGVIHILWSILRGIFHLLQSLWSLTDFLVPSEILALVLVILVLFTVYRTPSKS